MRRGLAATVLIPREKGPTFRGKRDPRRLAAKPSRDDVPEEDEEVAERGSVDDDPIPVYPTVNYTLSRPPTVRSTRTGGHPTYGLGQGGDSDCGILEYLPEKGHWSSPYKS